MLSKLLKKKYGIELERLWNPELTLGSLFSKVPQQIAPADAPNSGASLF